MTSTPLTQHALPTEDSPLAPGNKVVFSSYPGTIFSCDDFYILGTGLVSPPPVSPFFLLGRFSPGALGGPVGTAAIAIPGARPILPCWCLDAGGVCVGVCVGGRGSVVKCRFPGLQHLQPAWGSALRHSSSEIPGLGALM